MNAMRLFWLAVAALFAAALVAAFRGSDPPRPVAPDAPDAPDAPSPTAEATPEPPPDPMPVPGSPPSVPALPRPAAFPSIGRGTEREPFRIGWELLALGREAIGPGGALDLPPALRAIENAWVEIDGHFAAPIAAETAREIMVMLNRWDGCCIGVPPTPFDCIETSLAEPLELRGRHQIRFGTVRGILRIEPFLIGDLVLGLYRMEGASLRGG